MAHLNSSFHITESAKKQGVRSADEEHAICTWLKNRVDRDGRWKTESRETKRYMTTCYLILRFVTEYEMSNYIKVFTYN